LSWYSLDATFAEFTGITGSSKLVEAIVTPRATAPGNNRGISSKNRDIFMSKLPV
jgi:hypothetical protein